MKKYIGFYEPNRVKQGVNETTLPLKEGETFWTVTLGKGQLFDVERQEDAEIISRLVRIENLLRMKK